MRDIACEKNNSKLDSHQARKSIINGIEKFISAKAQKGRIPNAIWLEFYQKGTWPFLVTPIDNARVILHWFAKAFILKFP